MKRVIASFLSAAMLLAAVPCSAETAVRTASASGAVEIYVAPDGDDKAAGTIDAPLATLDAAREKASAAADGKTPVNVYFRGGEYYFADTVKFTAKDSGTADAPITYAAYGDEEPRFTGAVTINTEDFERVTDKMYDRLPEESRDMVGVADLSKKGVKKMTQYTADTPMGSGAMDYTTGAKIYDAAVEFYFNDRAMTLAAWPNGYERYRCLVSKVISSTQFGGDTGGRMKNWLTAEYPIMSGPIRLSWGQTEAPIRAFDVETDTMIFQEVADTSDEINGRYTMGGLVDTPQIGKEGSFQVKNLIEELDVPGEYYVDYQNLKLYFYPPYSTLGIEMRLGVNEYNMIRMDETKYVTFKGITFEKNRETPVSLHSTDNIKFLSCDVKEAGIDGIELRDNCHNTLIDGCDFRSIGRNCIWLNDYKRENVDLSNIDMVSLTKQNNVVNNCSFWDFNIRMTHGSAAVLLNGCGNSVTNCRFNNCSTTPIYWKGNDHKISNNEFYNVLKHVTDQGAIYNGRTLIQQGVEMSYNYFHDIDTSSKSDGEARCVYADDCSGGLDIHHNIFVKGPQVVSLAGSWGTKFNDNIIADNDWAGGAWAQGYGSGTFYVAFNDFRRDQITNVYSLEAYKKYDIMHRLYWGSSWLAWGFEINGNIMYNNKQQFQLAAGVTELGITLDNCLIDSAVDSNMFNDPDNGDYTIKEDYEMPKGYEGVKEIKLEDIGLYESETRDDISAPLSDFKLYYPYDYTDSLQGRDVYLQWEQCINADRYKVEIALDENFESLVGTYDATEPYLYVDDLDNDATEYFWRVKAYQFGKDTKAEKYNSDGIRRFRTQDFDIVDTSALAEIIVKAEDIISKVTEGTEPGNIAFGASNNLKELVKTGKEYIELGKCLQTDVDNLVTLIEKEIGTIGKTVTRRYSTFTDILSAKDAWVTQSENNTDLTAFDGGAKLKTTGDEMVIYTNTSQPIENNMLYKFKVNSYIPYGSGGGVWQAICFQKKEDAGRKLWTTQKIGYMFLIKYNQIEVQLWDGAQNIIATIPNTLKSGGDSECTFGVLDFGAGQRIILEIDGETVFDHIEFDHIVRDDLYLSLWEPMETNDIYSTGGIAIMDVNPEDVPDNEVTLGTEASMGENDMKSILGSISGGEVKVSGGTKMSSEKTDNLKTIDFNIKPSLSSADQGVIFRASDTSFNEDTSNYYKLSFKSGKLILSKNNGGVKQNVAIARTDAIKSNEWNTMKISTNFENGGLRIIVYAGGREVINVYDSQAINKAGYFGVFNNSSSELTVKP